MPEVIIPNNFTPRDYQLDTFKHFHNGGDRGVDVWPRRAGKDTTALHLMATMMVNKVGNYWHLFPQQTQARKAIWNGINKEGKKILEEVFPLSIRKRTSQQEMTIELFNGAIYQLCGSDNYDALVGSNPVGTIFSEYPLTNPSAWDYIRPILAENGGWAYFIFTPRGRNHGFKLYEQAKLHVARQNEDPTRKKRWHCTKLTVHDINHIPADILADEREEMGDDEFKQEYETDFDAVVKGVIYSKQMKRMRDEKRIGIVPYHPDYPVKVISDLGKRDSTALIFVQTVLGQIRFIDYYENNGEEVAHYAKILQEKPYVYEKTPLILPHDGKHTKLGQEFSVQEQFEALGYPAEVLEVSGVEEGINTTRSYLSNVWIDEIKCARLLDCLSTYHYKYNEKLKVLSNTPEHDWASDGADATRYAAVGYKAAEASRDRVRKVRPGII